MPDEAYRHTGSIDYLADFPGARREKDIIGVHIEDAVALELTGLQSQDYPDHEAGPHETTDGRATIGPLPVRRSSQVLVSVVSLDDEPFTASLEWLTSDGQTLVSESGDDLGLDTTVEGWTTPNRKGPEIELTIVDESGEDTNSVIAYIDTL